MNRFRRLGLTALPALLVVLAMLVVACGNETTPAADAPADETGQAAPETQATGTTPADGTPSAGIAGDTLIGTAPESTAAAAGSAPDGTNATEATDWDTTNNFSLGNGEEHSEDFFYVDKCAQVTFHVTASRPVLVHWQDPSGKDPSEPPVTEWYVEVGEEGVSGELRATFTPVGTGHGYLGIQYGYGLPAKAEGTISYRVDPPASGTTC